MTSSSIQAVSPYSKWIWSFLVNFLVFCQVNYSLVCLVPNWRFSVGCNTCISGKSQMVHNIGTQGLAWQDVVIFVDLSVVQPSFYRQGWLMILWYRTCNCQFWGIHWCFFPRFIWYWCVNWFCCRVPSLVRNRGQDGHLHQCICYWFLPSGFLSLRFILFIVKLRRLISRLVIVWLDVSHFQ